MTTEIAPTIIIEKENRLRKMQAELDGLYTNKNISLGMFSEQGKKLRDLQDAIADLTAELHENYMAGDIFGLSDITLEDLDYSKDDQGSANYVSDMQEREAKILPGAEDAYYTLREAEGKVNNAKDVVNTKEAAMNVVETSGIDTILPDITDEEFKEIDMTFANLAKEAYKNALSENAKKVIEFSKEDIASHPFNYMRHSLNMALSDIAQAKMDLRDSVVCEKGILEKTYDTLACAISNPYTALKENTIGLMNTLHEDACNLVVEATNKANALAKQAKALANTVIKEATMFFDKAMNVISLNQWGRLCQHIEQRANDYLVRDINVDNKNLKIPYLQRANDRNRGYENRYTKMMRDNQTNIYMDRIKEAIAIHIVDKSIRPDDRDAYWAECNAFVKDASKNIWVEKEEQMEIAKAKFHNDMLPSIKDFIKKTGDLCVANVGLVAGNLMADTRGYEAAFHDKMASFANKRVRRCFEKQTALMELDKETRALANEIKKKIDEFTSVKAEVTTSMEKAFEANPQIKSLQDTLESLSKMPEGLDTKYMYETAKAELDKIKNSTVYMKTIEGLDNNIDNLKKELESVNEKLRKSSKTWDKVVAKADDIIDRENKHIQAAKELTSRAMSDKMEIRSKVANIKEDVKSIASELKDEYNDILEGR